MHGDLTPLYAMQLYTMSQYDTQKSLVSYEQALCGSVTVSTTPPKIMFLSVYLNNSILMICDL